MEALSESALEAEGVDHAAVRGPDVLHAERPRPRLARGDTVIRHCHWLAFLRDLHTNLSFIAAIYVKMTVSPTASPPPASQTRTRRGHLAVGGTVIEPLRATLLPREILQISVQTTKDSSLQKGTTAPPVARPATQPVAPAWPGLEPAYMYTRTVQ